MERISTISEHACFGGTQGFYQHPSVTIGLSMKFGVYVPPQARLRSVPVLFFLAGLTCNEETFAVKAGAQRIAAELGLMLVTPDTSPRSTGVTGASESWDFGDGAGFYLDASIEPWAAHWRMETYISQELRSLILESFAADSAKVGILGHSMGGHGALTLALKYPHLYQSVSAFAPVCSPIRCPWGINAFSGFLGDDKKAWANHDATELLKSGARSPPMLIDQGLSDKFLAEQLYPDSLEQACEEAGQPLRLRRHPGYDHGYYFIASFIEDHLRHHAETLFDSATGFQRH